MTNLDLTTDQEKALTTVGDWITSPGASQVLTLGGYAGTGKTTVVAELARRLPKVRTRWCAYTGKAASVLRRKLGEAGIAVERQVTRRDRMELQQLVTTVHSLIKTYHENLLCTVSSRRMRQDENGDPLDALCGDPQCRSRERCHTRIVSSYGDKPRESLAGIDLIVLDEASMIGRELWRDLLSYDIPILAVGDHGQLPPVKDDSPGLMIDPHVRLEKLHRYAETSGINVVARLARETGRIPPGRWDLPGGYAAKITGGGGPPINFGDDLAVLCGRRATRATWNKIVRQARGLHDEARAVRVGDRVTCLRNSLTTYNGMIGTVTHVEPLADQRFADITVQPDGGADEHPVTSRAPLVQFGRADNLTADELRILRRDAGGTGLLPWDWAYALTVHKAQGSGFPRVVVMEEKLPGGDEKHARWLYTAVTRAESKLLVIG